MAVAVPGCPGIEQTGVHGQPEHCTAEPTLTAVVRWFQPRGWQRCYFCARHAPDDAEPMDARHRADLVWRREQWAEGLAGRPFTAPPVVRYRDEA